MFKRILYTLKPHVRSLHSHSSTPTSRNGVTLSVISAAVAGTALWYFNAQNIYNDAAEPMELKKQKNQAPGTTGTSTDPNTIYSLVWGSNRLAVLVKMLYSSLNYVIVTRRYYSMTLQPNLSVHQQLQGG